MRDLKFRVGDYANRKFFYSAKSHLFSNMQQEFGLIVNLGRSSCLVKSELILDADTQLFTGMHDDQGREIYEGDIIDGIPNFTFRNTTGIGVIKHCEVYWSAGGCRVKINSRPLQLSKILYKTVVGTVHPNPELLEAKL